MTWPIHRIWVARIVCFAVFASISLDGAARGQGNQRQEAQKGAQTELPIKAVTAQEMAHAKLHDRGFENRPKLTESIETYPSVTRPAPGTGPDYRTFLKDHVCNADLVVQGTVLNWHSMYNASETYLFTDYMLKSETVFRSTTKLQNGPITVTRLGGLIVSNGKKISALESTNPPLQKDHRYILLLDSVPGFPSYQDHPRLNVIEDQGQQVSFSPRGGWSPELLFTQKFTFADVQADVRSAVALCR